MKLWLLSEPGTIPAGRPFAGGRAPLAFYVHGASSRVRVDNGTLQLVEADGDAAQAAAIKADNRCCVLWCAESTQHETGKLALRAWLGARGLRSAEIDAACGPMAAPKSGQELVDSVMDFLQGVMEFL